MSKIPSRPGTHYLLKRGSKYLQENYYWGSFPHTFPEWQFPAVLEMSMQFKDPPQMVGELYDGTLENAIWQRLGK